MSVTILKKPNNMVSVLCLKWIPHPTFLYAEYRCIVTHLFVIVTQIYQLCFSLMQGMRAANPSSSHIPLLDSPSSDYQETDV